MGRVAAALRALTGRGPRTSALLRAPEEEVAEPAAEPVAEAVAEVKAPPRGEDAAARIDAARERLRATIAPPGDDDGSP